MSKPLGPPAAYIDLLDHFTKERIKEEAQEPPKYDPLRPSSAGKCTRELGYQLMEYMGKAKYEKKLREPASDRLLKLGNPIEWHLFKQFQEAFKRADKDIRILYKQQTLRFFKKPDGTRVKGAIDGTFISPKWGVLIDVKSKKDKFHKAYKTDWDATNEQLTDNPYVNKISDSAFYIEDLEGFLENLNNAFWADNFYQLNFYFFDKDNFIRDEGIDHAALIYYCKNDSRLREIRFKPSEKVYNQIKDKFTNVFTKVEGDKVEELPKDHTIGSIKCAFCQFSKNCWGDANTLKEYFKTFPRKTWPKDTDRMNKVTCERLEDLYVLLKDWKKDEKQADMVEKEIIKLFDIC